MSAFLARLNPAERRFVVFVAVFFFIIINVVWVIPHFSDWGNMKDRLDGARVKLVTHEKVIADSEKLKPEVARLKGKGGDVPPEDMSLQFLRTIQDQAMKSGVGIGTFGTRQTSTNNPFFVEVVQTITFTSGEKQLVDFLYNLGGDGSMVRVRSMAVQPDGVRQQLSGNITLVASYQKKPKAPARTAPAAGTPARTPTATTTTTKPPPSSKPSQTPTPPGRPVGVQPPNKK